MTQRPEDEKWNDHWPTGAPKIFTDVDIACEDAGMICDTAINLLQTKFFGEIMLEWMQA
jgi:hypothetical protein